MASRAASSCASTAPTAIGDQFVCKLYGRVVSGLHRTARIEALPVLPTTPHSLHSSGPCQQRSTAVSESWVLGSPG
ncbi:hypothetical protein WJX77_008635 [Trebouxia sp. C0004]